MAMHCAYHPDKEPVGACVECGKLICVECKALLGGRLYCTPCADKKFVHKQADPAPAPANPAQAAPVYYSAPAAPPPAAPPAQAAAYAPAQAAAPAQMAAPATVVAPKAPVSDLPAGLRGWNWGAFMFTWIWGIVNKVWISFLVFIPMLNIVWVFVLGAKGNEWAWKARSWDSLDHFQRHQKAWKPWAIAVFILGILSMVAYGILIIVLIATGNQVNFG